MDDSSFDKDAGHQIKRVIESKGNLAYFGPKETTDELVAKYYKCQVIKRHPLFKPFAFKHILLQVIVHVWETAMARNIMSMAISKNSSLMPFLSLGIMKLIEHGNRQAEMSRLKSVRQMDCISSNLEVNPMSVYQLASLFTLLSVSFVIALILLGYEVLSSIRDMGLGLDQRRMTVNENYKLRQAKDLVFQLEDVLFGTSFREKTISPLMSIKHSLNFHSNGYNQCY